MLPTELIASANVPRSGVSVRKLLVTRKLPPNNLYETIGILSRMSDDTFHFSYLDTYAQAEYFRELPGLRKVRGGVTSDRLFPFFAERVISPERPDRATALSYLNLEEPAEPFEVLARSGGSRLNDQLEVLPFPEEVSKGQYAFTFFVHGIRYLDDTGYNALEQLHSGDSLQVEREPSNPESELALKVSHHETPLGYVPHPLRNFINPAVATDGYTLTVVQRNSPNAGFHQRLLVRLMFQARSDEAMFSGVDLKEY
jgi:hypothetical protein